MSAINGSPTIDREIRQDCFKANAATGTGYVVGDKLRRVNVHNVSPTNPTPEIPVSVWWENLTQGTTLAATDVVFADLELCGSALTETILQTFTGAAYTPGAGDTTVTIPASLSYAFGASSNGADFGVKSASMAAFVTWPGHAAFSQDIQRSADYVGMYESVTLSLPAGATVPTESDTV